MGAGRIPGMQVFGNVLRCAGRSAVKGHTLHMCLCAWGCMCVHVRMHVRVCDRVCGWESLLSSCVVPYGWAVWSV